MSQTVHHLATPHSTATCSWYEYASCLNQCFVLLSQHILLFH